MLLSCICSFIYSLFTALLCHCGLCCLSIRVSPFSTGGGVYYIYIGLCTLALLMLVINTVLFVRLLSGIDKIKRVAVAVLTSSTLMFFPLWQAWQILLKMFL